MIRIFNTLAAVLVAVGSMLVLAEPASAQDSKKRSSETVSPRAVRSQSFVMHTDLSDDDADELLKRLEKMLKIISKYWGRPNRQTIEMYVVKDLKNWNGLAFDPDGLRSVRSGGGLTKFRKVSQGRQFFAKAVVYAIADRGTPQHEAVHAYCYQTFGTSGPVWYSEGMAEMGQYWVENDASVNCPRFVARYIHSVKPRLLSEIVNRPRETTGDSWQNYAWRWALCHLLATNPNYSQRFRPLGVGILTGQKTSFQKVYGSMSKEIAFEYQFFLKHFDPGYRADLCAWDWKARYRVARSTGTPVVSKITAHGGWQASRCIVKKGEEYDFLATGEWQIDEKSSLVNADGHADGRGKLVGAIFDDDKYKLGKPFELGTFGKWTAPADGQLLLRCQQPWTEITDEDAGKISFRIKVAGAGKPFEAAEADKK